VAEKLRAERRRKSLDVLAVLLQWYDVGMCVDVCNVELLLVYRRRMWFEHFLKHLDDCVRSLVNSTFDLELG
jgi:hypothetical protein